MVGRGAGGPQDDVDAFQRVASLLSNVFAEFPSRWVTAGLSRYKHEIAEGGSWREVWIGCGGVDRYGFFLRHRVSLMLWLCCGHVARSEGLKAVANGAEYVRNEPPAPTSQRYGHASVPHGRRLNERR